MRLLFAWLESTGHRVDIEGLRLELPQFDWHGYRDWVRSQLDRFRELCEHPEPVAG